MYQTENLIHRVYYYYLLNCIEVITYKTRGGQQPISHEQLQIINQLLKLEFFEFLNLQYFFIQNLCSKVIKKNHDLSKIHEESTNISSFEFPPIKYCLGT